MDKKSKIFLLVYFLILVAVVGFTYYKYFIALDYYIQAEAECDPETERCYIYECTPEEDAACPVEEEDRISYYKLVKKRAYQIPQCDPNDETCNALECLPGQDCVETLCEVGNEEQIECNDPEEYLKLLEAEETETAGECEDDEDCQLGDEGAEEEGEESSEGEEESTEDGTEDAADTSGEVSDSKETEAGPELW